MIWTEDNRDPLWKDFLFFPPWTILIRSIKLCVHNWTEKRETFRWGKVDRTILTSRENEADACVIPPRQYPWTDQWVLSTVVRSTEVFFIFYSLLLLSLFFFFFFFALKGGKKKSEKLRNERQKIDLGISRNSIFCFSSFNSNVLGLEVDNCRRK